jgi:putative salt-induced outer membrane protein YdiY
MKKSIQIPVVSLAGLLLVVFFSAGLQAEEKPVGWSDAAELSYVMTSGNAGASTIGVTNSLLRKWEKSLFSLKAGFIRAETTTKTRIAVAPDPANLENYEVVKKDHSQTGLEFYHINGRYDHKISERLFWYGGAGWERNRTAGVLNRFGMAGGVGKIWRDRPDLKFKTDAALTLTHEEDVVHTPGVDEFFAGLRFTYDLSRKLSGNTEYTSFSALDENLQQGHDLRWEMDSAVKVSMSKRLALKVGYRTLFDNLPASVSIPLESPEGTPTGTSVLARLGKWDTIFSTSLVYSF